MKTFNFAYHKVTIVKKPWAEVGKETYCGKPDCDECRVIDKVTQGSGSSKYHDHGTHARPWQARVIQMFLIDTPIPDKQYRVWIIELFRTGVNTEQYQIETVTEHWSSKLGKWCYG